VDVLLFTFVLGVFVVQVRPLRAEFVVQVVRSPDGHSSQMAVGHMSIQRAAVWLLEQYYKDFGVYNPWLESGRGRKGKAAGGGGRMSRQQSRHGVDNENFEETADAVSLRSKRSARSVVGGNVGANDRFYEEYEQVRVRVSRENGCLMLRRCLIFIRKGA
jgi:vang-like